MLERFGVGRCCCVPAVVPDSPCEACIHSTDDVAVTVSGLLDARCTTCALNFNTTYICSIDDPLKPCLWHYNPGGGLFLFCQPGVSVVVTVSVAAVPNLPTYLSLDNNAGWWVTFKVEGGFYTPDYGRDIGNYGWDSGAKELFDCTLPRNLTLGQHSHLGVEQCANIDGLTIRIN